MWLADRIDKVLWRRANQPIPPPPAPDPDPLVRACLDCRGSGVWHENLNAAGTEWTRQHCPYCNGTRDYPYKTTKRW